MNRASVSPRGNSVQPDATTSTQYLASVSCGGQHSSTINNYSKNLKTPTKGLHHPPGWDRITWAPKVCRKSVSRFNMGEVAAH